MILNGLLDDWWDGFVAFMADMWFLLVLFSILPLSPSLFVVKAARSAAEDHCTR